MIAAVREIVEQKFHNHFLTKVSSMKLSRLCTAALVAFCTSPASAVVYHFEYLGAEFESHPDPVEGKVWTVDPSYLFMSVHETLLDFSGGSTAKISGSWDNQNASVVYINGHYDPPGFSLSGNMFVTNNELSLIFDIQLLQVTDWVLYSYEEYGYDYYSTPLGREAAWYVGWEEWYDEELGHYINIAELFELLDYKFIFGTSVPGTWTVSRTPSLASEMPSPVPLPAGLPLLATALLALGLWRRRSRVA